jgi:hypothetical protein
VVAAGSVGPFLLQWPEGLQEGAGTIVLALVGLGCRIVCSSRSRFGFPSVDVETTTAATLRRNKSSSVLLRRQWRAYGGGPPGVEALYMRCMLTARRPGREVTLMGFCLVGVEATLGCAK